MEDQLFDPAASPGPISALGPGDQVTFVEFGENGKEEILSGLFWALAPNVGGMPAAWVTAVAGRPSAVAVVRASRRHRVGLASGGLWRPKSGRYVDPTTLYTEEDRRSPTGALTHLGSNPPERPSSWPFVIGRRKW
jgi:hypothetical protein